MPRTKPMWMPQFLQEQMRNQKTKWEINKSIIDNHKSHKFIRRQEPNCYFWIFFVLPEGLIHFLPGAISCAQFRVWRNMSGKDTAVACLITASTNFTLLTNKRKSFFKIWSNNNTTFVILILALQTEYWGFKSFSNNSQCMEEALSLLFGFL